MIIENDILRKVSSSDLKDGAFVIPDNVKYITVTAFDDCLGLTKIYIPSSVISIELDTFLRCSSLEEVDMSDDITIINNYDFEDCLNLKKIHLPNKLKIIGYQAFKGCTNLEKIIISDSVVSIGNGAFYECKNLESINIPKGVTQIGAGTFYGCSCLKTIEIPDSVTNIGKNAFTNCTMLRNISIPEGIIVVEACTFKGCTNLKTIKLPNSLKYIREYAFSSCSSLEQIIIPDSVEKIECKAFLNCERLEKVIINKGITSIEDNSFSCCYSLEDIELPQGLINIGAGAFEDCFGLKTINLPKGLRSIGSNAFGECIGLNNITLPSSLKKIESSAFESCEKLNQIKIPNGITTIEEKTFTHCYNLEKVELPNNLISIEHAAFYLCESLQKIEFPNSLKKIERKAFSSCSSLESVNIPSSVTSIGNYAFSGCSNLKYINICNLNCSIDSSMIKYTDLKWMYINMDGLMSFCKEKRDEDSKRFLEIDLSNEETKKFMDTNYRMNYVTLHNWKKEGKIKFIPPEYTLMAFPYTQIDNYFINGNNKIWGKLVQELGLTTLEENEKNNSLTDLMKIYYAIGGFSPNQGERDVAYKYIIEYANKYFKDASPSELGEDIHRRFSRIELKGEYNKDFAIFFMRYFNDKPDFMKFRLEDRYEELMEEKDYLCNAHNAFESILKSYPNRVVNGNEERAILSPLFVAIHSNRVIYSNVNSGSEELALLVGKYCYSQNQFNKIQEIYEEAKKQKDDCVIKIGKANEDDSVTFRLLEKDDPLGFVLGDITNCCQHIGGVAASCVEDGYKNPNAGFLTFETINKETGKTMILGQAYIWYDPKTKTVCYDNIEIPNKILDELKKKTALIKIEDLLNAVEKSAGSIMKAMNKDKIKVERVTTGEGYNDLKKVLENRYLKEVPPRTFRGGDVYSDAKEKQYIIKTYDKITKKYSEKIRESIEENNKIIKSTKGR